MNMIIRTNGALLEMILLSALQSFARILIHNAFLFITPQQCLVIHVIRVFPKVDHSANIARIVLVEYTIGSVVESNFC